MGDEMDFTPRIKQILNVLLLENVPISIKSLAEKIGVSKRTVQRELEYMDSSLKGYGVQFMSRTGVGVWLEGDPQERQRLADALSGTDSYDGSNREERRKRLILEILREKGLKKLFYYSSQFKVSEATISKDLEAVEEWLNRYRLYVERKPGSGVCIQGTEADYRRAIREFISENIDSGVLHDLYGIRESEEKTEDLAKLKKSNIGKILNDDILKRVVNTIVGIDEGRLLSLTESSYMGLVLHVSIAMNRILKGEVIGYNEKLIASVQQDEDYELAKRIVYELEEEFETEIPQMEVYYICLHIKGSKHQRISVENDKTLQSGKKEIQVLINHMIDAFDPDIAFLLKQDEDFIQGLLAHLQPTLVRIMYEMQIKNPVLDEIKKSYGDIFEKCKAVSRVLQEWTGKDVPEAETGYLTLHFGAALVRLEDRKENLRQVSVGIVCASGIGISRLMSSKIEKAFRDRVHITAYGKNDVTPYIAANTDFFISSISLEQVDAPIVYVNPLLNEEDMEHIGEKVFQFERTPAKQQEETKFSRELEQINFVANQIKLIIQYMEYIEVEESVTFEGLVDVISRKMSCYGDWSEEIRRDIMKRERLGTQIFAEFGFGLLHTRTKGVIRPGVSVCMTESKGAFADPYFKGIHVVIVMLLPEDEHVKENSDILGYISSTLIEDYAFLDTIQKGDKETIRGVLSKYLKQYFNQYINKM